MNKKILKVLMVFINLWFLMLVGILFIVEMIGQSCIEPKDKIVPLVILFVATPPFIDKWMKDIASIIEVKDNGKGV